MVTITVPATTANLGPGFDCLGCALNRYAVFTADLQQGVTVTGCDAAYCNEDNLFVTAFLAAAQAWGLSVPGIRVDIRSDIPVSRGLGSSAALIVGGVMAADALTKAGKTKEEMLKVANRLEGHPDNVAPALYGGLRLSMVQGDAVVSVPLPIHSAVRFLALIPPFALSTKAARAALPATVPHADAVFNAAHLAMLLQALAKGDAALIRQALQDRLHQPYRFPLIAESDDIRHLADALGADGFFISGAGPTLMCLYHEPEFLARMTEAIQALRHPWQVVPLLVDMQGARVQ